MKEIKFYVNKYSWVLSTDEVDFSFIPAMLRRRMSKFDKVTFYSLYKCFNDNIQNIVFSSKSGEVEKLIKIIDQYSSDGEVSPSLFSGSVHNYSVGLFLQNMQKSIPYTALSASEDSLAEGLLTAAISGYENNIFCYSNIINEEIHSIALNISKSSNNNFDKYQIVLQNNSTCKQGNFNNFVELFRGNLNSVATPLYRIERINNVG